MSRRKGPLLHEAPKRDLLSSTEDYYSTDEAAQLLDEPRHTLAKLATPRRRAALREDRPGGPELDLVSDRRLHDWAEEHPALYSGGLPTRPEQHGGVCSRRHVGAVVDFEVEVTSGAELTAEDLRAIVDRVDFTLVLPDGIRFRGRDRLKGARVKVTNVAVHARYTKD